MSTLQEKDEKKRALLGSRMAYLLKYGAVKEGLQLHPEGFVFLKDLLSLNLMKHYTEHDIYQAIANYHRLNGDKSYEIKDSPCGRMIRAVHGRVMEQSMFHAGSSVKRLLHICVEEISDNIKRYDLENFPDEFLMRKIFHRLKWKNKLTNATMKCLISCHVEAYNFHNVYITENTMRLVCKRCKMLKKLNLMGCGYLVTDHIMKTVLKNLKFLKELNISDCPSVTDDCLYSLVQNETPLSMLNISYCTNITLDGLKYLLLNCKTLRILVLFGIRGRNKKYGEELLAYFKEHGGEETLQIYWKRHTPKNPTSFA